MKSTVKMSLVLVLTALLTATSGAQEQQQDYRRMPWHLVDIWWNLGEDRVFESYAIDFTIEGEVAEDADLYLSPVGLGHFGDTAFYGGLQTNVLSMTKENMRRRPFGRGVIFSRWGERELDAIRPATGGIMDSSGHEGDFIGVRRRYKWSAGTYTFKLVAMDKQFIDGKPHRWVGCFVRSHDNDEEEYMGALRFEGDDLVMKRSVAAFVEIYGRRKPIEKIPTFTVTFKDIRVNGQTIEKRTAQAIYPDRVPDYAEAAADGTNVVITVGKAVEREERNERLY